MFNKNSRYYGLETWTVGDGKGRSVQAVKLRPLPQTAGEDMTVTDSSQLDVMSQQRYKDATRYWHIADANSELEANTLVGSSGRIIKVPKK